MQTNGDLSRRSFLSFFAAAPLWTSFAADKRIPVGLELYSVRNELKKDLTGTVRGVAKLGNDCVEFYKTYYDWTLDYAKDVRKELDAFGVHFNSTHNYSQSFTPDRIGRAAVLKQALRAR